MENRVFIVLCELSDSVTFLKTCISCPCKPSHWSMVEEEEEEKEGEVEEEEEEELQFLIHKSYRDVSNIREHS